MGKIFLDATAMLSILSLHLQQGRDHGPASPCPRIHRGSIAEEIAGEGAAPSPSSRARERSGRGE